MNHIMFKIHSFFFIHRFALVVFSIKVDKNKQKTKQKQT